MRQIFSSQRVETAEGVAKLLRDAGIEVHISNGRSYHSKRTGQFSYRDKPSDKNQPTVWVVHANDQPAAREILRNARLLETTRSDHPTADYVFRDGTDTSSGRRWGWGWRIRAALLLMIAAIVLFIVLRQPSPAPSAPVSAPPATAPAAEDQNEDEVRVRIQPPQG